MAGPSTNLAWQTLFDLSTAGRGPRHEMRFHPDPDRPAILPGYSNLTGALADEAVAVLATVVRRVAARRRTPG